jgi:hypothetical protein
MHTLVFWAAVLSLIPLTAGIVLEVLGRLRDSMAPPATDGPPATPRAPRAGIDGRVPAR